MSGGFELFRVRGIAVRLHQSFLFLGILMAVLAMAAGGTGVEVGLRLLNPVLLLLTVILHELGHALIARRLGVTVLDVLLTPMGGMARLEGDLRDPKLEGLIALAGPTTNLILAALSLGLIQILGRGAEVSWRDLALFLENENFLRSKPLVIFFGFNVLLGIVNLVPAFPADGGRILRAALSLRFGRLIATRIACRIGTTFAFVLILLPFFMTGSQWWIMPFIGLYLLFACIRERLRVMAQEGLGAGGIQFQFFQQAADFAAQQQRRQPGGPGAAGESGSPFEAVEPTPHIDDDGIIDVSATSRLVDDEDEDEEKGA